MAYRAKFAEAGERNEAPAMNEGGTPQLFCLTSKTNTGKKTNWMERHAPVKLNNRHRAMLMLILQGMSQKRIAVALGMDASRVCVVVNSSVFKTELSKLEASLFETAKERYGAMLPAALEVLGGLLNHGQARVRLAAAREVFNRAIGRTTPAECEEERPLLKSLYEELDRSRKSRC